MGQWNWRQFQSWWLAGNCYCRLSVGIAPVTSLFWRTCQMLLVQGQKWSFPSQYTGPGSQSWFWAPGLIYFKVVSYLCTSWDWRLVPCSRQSRSSIHYLHVGGMSLIWPSPHLFSIFLVLVLNSQFVCAVICTGLQRRKSILILLLVVLWIDKNKKSDRQDKFPVTTFFPSIVSHGNAIRFSTSEYFPIKGCSLRLYNRVMKCHNTRGDMSAMTSMSQHSNYNIHGTSSTFIHMCQLTPNCLRAKYARRI